MGGEGDATKVLDVVEDFGDRYVEITAWRVPESERYPDGLKYSMQYGTAGGETIFRYDNFPDHPEATTHHKHTSNGSVQAVDFEGLQALYEQFRTEVNEYGDTW